MIAELNAIKAILGAADALQAGRTVPCLIGDATGTMPPFTVAWGSLGIGDPDESFGGPDGSWRAPAGITCTAQDPEAAMALMQAVRDVLAPSGRPTVLPGVAGRHVVVEFTDARAVQVDRTVTPQSTNAHPAFGVLLLDIISQPVGS